MVLEDYLWGVGFVKQKLHGCGKMLAFPLPRKLMSRMFPEILPRKNQHRVHLLRISIFKEDGKHLKEEGVTHLNCTKYWEGSARAPTSHRQLVGTHRTITFFTPSIPHSYSPEESVHLFIPERGPENLALCPIVRREADLHAKVKHSPARGLKRKYYTNTAGTCITVALLCSKDLLSPVQP